MRRICRHSCTTPLHVTLPAGKAAAKAEKAAGDKAAEESSLSENLKCACCLGLCERPVTVRAAHGGWVLRAEEGGRDL